MKIRELFDDKVNILRKNGKVTIVEVDNKKYAVKESDKDICSIYKHLESRDFKCFPKLLFRKYKYNIFEYIEEYDSRVEEKGYDMIYLLSLLHNKTTYYKEMDKVEYKSIFENISNEINRRVNYYNNLIDKIEIHMFNSPSEYLIARNISKILGALEYSKNSIIKWYDLVKENAKKRVVTLYNNIDLNHIIRNKDVYLISWDKVTSGVPIYDLYNFYIRYNDIFDFENLIKRYEEKYPLKEEEKILFFTLISIPNMIILNENEIDNCKKLKKMIDTLYKSEMLISKFENK